MRCICRPASRYGRSAYSGGEDPGDRHEKLRAEAEVRWGGFWRIYFGLMTVLSVGFKTLLQANLQNRNEGRQSDCNQCLPGV